MRPFPHAPAAPHARTIWPLAIPIVVFATFILGQLIVLLPAAKLGLITRETVETYPTVLYLIIGSFTAVALLAYFGIRFWERQSLGSVGLSFSRGSVMQACRGYALGLALGASCVGAVFLLGGYVAEPQQPPQTRDWLPIIILMLAFILQSFTEEVIFRGWMLARIANRYGILAGVIGNSILFTLMHVELGADTSPEVPVLIIFTLMTFLFSIFLSLLTIRQQSVMGASAFHAAWNWVYISWFALPTTGIDLGLTPLITQLSYAQDAVNWLTGAPYGPEASIVGVVILTTGIAFLIATRSMTQSTAGATQMAT